MSRRSFKRSWFVLGAATLLVAVAGVALEDEDFGSLVKRLQGSKAESSQRHQKLLQTRYDLSDRAADGVKMARGKGEQWPA